MNISSVQNQGLRFAAVKFTLNNQAKTNEKSILTALTNHFPKGTYMEVKDLYCGESSAVTISGPSSEAEQKISEALLAAGFRVIKTSPFQGLSDEQKRIMAGLKVLDALA